jgi:hypothetical protein
VQVGAYAGTWPFHQDYVMFGHAALDHTVVGNYAFIQSNLGVAFFKAPTGRTVNFMINALQKMKVQSDGKILVGASGSADASWSVSGISSFGDGAAATPSLAHKGDLDTGMWFPAADTVAWSTGGVERERLDSNGNRGIGTTSFGSSAAKVLGIGNGTPPGSSPADMVQLYAEDVSSSSELKVRDEAGNITTLSPHNFSLIGEGPSEEMAWSYFSERDGRRINVDMLKAIRVLERLSGEKLVHEAGPI